MSRYTVDMPCLEALSITATSGLAIFEEEDADLVVVGLGLAFSIDNLMRTPTELIKTCGCCGHFFVRCASCSLSNLASCQGGPLVCHRYRVIYTDGSCLDNGTPNAAAGVGIAFGTKTKARISRPVGEDPTGQHNNHTNQRAELLAAIHGIKSIDKWTSTNRPCPDRKSLEEKRTRVWVLTTDSEYVVNGMTKWLPKWKVGGPAFSIPSADLMPPQNNNMRASNGRRPENLDLFLRLESLVTDGKQNKGIAICFWRIPREYNSIADGLAEKGAKTAQALRRAHENHNML